MNNNMKYKFVKSGIQNLKSGYIAKPTTKAGKPSKRFFNLVRKMKPSDINKTVKKFGLENDKVLKELKDRKDIIFSQTKNKFYNKALKVGKINYEDQIKKNDVVLSKESTQKIEDEYKPQLRTELISLNKGKVEEIEVDLKKIRIKELIKMLVKELTKPNFISTIQIGSKVYTMNTKFKQEVLKGNINKAVKNQTKGSDANFLMASQLYSTALIKFFKKEKNPKPSGEFFKYYHTLGLCDFSKYGIYRKEQINKKTYDHNCLYYALKAGGMSEEKLNTLKFFVLNRNVPICKLNEICKKLDIKIKLIQIIENLKHKDIIYGLNDNEVYEIILFEQHFFINEKTNYTRYSILNYDEIKHIKDFNKIEKRKKSGKYEKSNKRFISSFKLFKLLLENREKFLYPIPAEDYDKIQYKGGNEAEITNLNYDYTSYQKIKFKEKEEDKCYKIYFDFETWTDKKDNYKHKPYLVCIETEKGDKETFIGSKCAYDMLYYISTLNKNEIKLIAHNAKYDYTFISPFLAFENPLLKDGSLYSCDARFYYASKKYYNLKIIDSYKMISEPLSKFGLSFKLDQEKEIMPYDLYNISNPLEDKYINLEECLKYVKEGDRVNYIRNCLKFGCLYENYGLIKDKKLFDYTQLKKYQVNIIDYSAKYCSIDCEVLRKGYETFGKWISSELNLKTENYLTSASLADSYMTKEGAYDGCYKLSSVPRAFIQKCVVGGRVMSNNNKKYNLNIPMADYDACSLYPSAMSRLGDIGGYLKGLPKVLKEENKNMDFLNSVDGYFIQIKIKKVGIKRDFPLLSKITEEGIRNFTNDMKNEIIYIDKIALEDAIKFQKLEFDILKGYYFNEGRNKNIKDIIHFLYDKRAKLRKKKNPMEKVYKLIMNSCYGKTILKPTETKSEIVKTDNIKKYLTYNYNKINTLEKIDDKKYLVSKYEPINDHFNSCHIGVEILSMSKRIMNEVMCLAEDNGIKIYYQDTDSMHIPYYEVPKLEELFKAKYNRELNGKNMGQFHIDFKLKGACGDIMAIKTIILGKKCYLDILKSTDKDGKIIYGSHMRMKGIPEKSIEYESKKMNIKPSQLYELLYKGEKVAFDLTAGGSKCCFKYNNINNVRTLNDFEREIVFSDNKESLPVNRKC